MLTPGHPPLPPGVGTELFSLEGKVALVTGGSKGLGKGMAIGLAQAGATVLINSRNADDCAATVAQITAMGCKATVASFDVTDEAAIVANIAALAAAHDGHIDILLNNAGGTRRSPFLESSSEDLDFVCRLATLASAHSRLHVFILAACPWPQPDAALVVLSPLGLRRFSTSTCGVLTW